MRNLVLARVGRRSLHPCWVDPGRARSFDLRLVPYEDLAPQAGIDCVVGETIPGPKWTGLRQVLNDWDGWRDYDRIWLPDDDLYASQDTISRMFDLAGAVGLELFAPALHESSSFAHFITMENRRFQGRWTGFVEIMMPGFARAALERLLPTLDLTDTGYGWGLDSVWPKLLGYRDVGIIDATPVIHTRPVGRMRDAELARRVLAESDRILADHDCGQVHTTFGAFGADGTRLDLSPEALLVEVVRGSEYLFARDPRVLAWIVDFQRAALPPLAYPAEGTPS